MNEAGVSFTIHRILVSATDENERWVAIEDAPFNQRTGARQWMPDGAKRVVGQRVARTVTLDEKVLARRQGPQLCRGGCLRPTVVNFGESDAAGA